ncbi:MAG TPA: calcium-binding protein, partial [Allosphingosinicella sp.]
MPTFTGTSGDDTIQGTSSADMIDGLAGNDTLRGGGGADTIHGGEGEDLLVGNMQNDHLDGGDGNDLLVPLGGADFVDGGDGQDSIVFEGVFPNQGVSFDLRLQGQAQAVGFYGTKTVVNVEHVFGSRFSDVIHGDDDLNVLSAGGSLSQPQVGDDQLFGHGGDDIFQLTAGNHYIDGGDGADSISTSFTTADMGAFSIDLNIAGAQNTGQGMMTFVSIANLIGGRYDDRLEGDGSDNKLAGAYGNDILIGGAGNDRLSGDGGLVLGADRLFTTSFDGVGNGNDFLDGGAGDDELYGGGGSDTASYASASGAVTVSLYDGGFGEAFGAAGYDQLHDIENLAGSAFDDGLYGNGLDNIVSGGDGHDDVRGGGGNDEIHAGAGDDLLYGNGGDDLLDGGAGIDRAGYYSGATAGVTVDLNLQGIAQNTGQGMDTLVGIENVSGTVFADTLIGDGADNFLWGSPSTVSPGNVATTNDDTLSGGGGSDLLIAGIGDHVVDGGSGTDTFRFNENGNPETGIVVSLLLQGTVQASGNGAWSLTGIENLS